MKDIHDRGYQKLLSKSMLAHGEPVEKIQRYTGLSAATIKKLTAKKQRG